MTVRPLRPEESVTAQEREVLDLRRERLREKPAIAEEEAQLWVAEFPMGDERYAIPLRQLRGTVPLKMVTPVPLSPPHVVGVLRFQGQVIAALSLAALLGGRGWRQDPAVLLVVEIRPGELFAVDCEQVPQPLPIPQRIVDEARSRSTGPLCLVGIPGARPVTVVDLQSLLQGGDVRGA